jgi:hypothetical protein
MITEKQEYLDLLYKIQDENKPSLAILLPGDERIYNVDLATRTIEAPEYLSVETDHRSEVVYFKCPRYYDAVDLSNTVCVVQYINANKEGRVYAVPYYDIDTFSDTNEVLIPWEVDGEATVAAGNVQYALRFYMLDSRITDKRLVYNLNTLTASSKVLHGIDIDPEELQSSNDKEYIVTYLDEILAISREIANKDVYWVVL